MSAPNFEEHFWLVKSEAANLALRSPADIEYDDLCQEGALGLLRTLQRFDAERGCKFSSYTRPRIRGQMQDSLRQLGPLALRTPMLWVGNDFEEHDVFQIIGRTSDSFRYITQWPFDLRQALYTALEALPDHQRLLLSLYYVYEMTFEEIGEELGFSGGYLASLHERTILQLRAQLRDYR